MMHCDELKEKLTNSESKMRTKCIQLLKINKTLVRNSSYIAAIKFVY